MDFKSLMSYPTKNPYQSNPERKGVDDVTPRPLPEVQITNESNQVLDRYREVYKVRYGVEPIISNPGLANTQTKDLIRKVGMKRAIGLVEQYLKLNGDNDWYVRTGHSLRTFETKIEEINAAFGLSMKRSGPGNYDPMIVFNTQCPGCNAWHDITCRASEVEKHAYLQCRACIEK